MEETPSGTSVGVDDPYEFAGVCDRLADDGRCRYALDCAGRDPSFAAERRADDYRCLVGESADGDGRGGADCDWRVCPHYRSTTDARECLRCGLEEVRMAHEDARPLLEEHHLSYGGGGPDAEPSHEITVALCRWCHSKVHDSWARIADDARPDPEALAAREARRSKEQVELGFRSAADRYDLE